MDERRHVAMAFSPITTRMIPRKFTKKFALQIGLLIGLALRFTNRIHVLLIKGFISYFSIFTLGLKFQGNLNHGIGSQSKLDYGFLILRFTDFHF